VGTQEQRDGAALDAVPFERDQYDYVQHSSPQIVEGADGMPVIAGAGPAEGAPQGLTSDNFICSGNEQRRPCRYYAPVLLDTTAQWSGPDRPKSLRRFCTKLATATEPFELTELNVYACLQRSSLTADEISSDPADVHSRRLIEKAEARQREIGDKGKREHGELDL